MNFVHADPQFGDLLRIVATARRISIGLVEKDYWVTHALWALHDQGFDVWFKGGTSLSKGFGLINRFSEDLDLKVEQGRTQLPPVTSWKGEGKKATADREEFFRSFGKLFVVPGATVQFDQDTEKRRWRSANFRVMYPGKHLADLGGVMKPFVLLEIGSARVTPAVARDLSSFVHEHLVSLGQLGEFIDNRPRAVRCVHPIVTLLEKLDALSHRFPRLSDEPATFVRHYEDAAQIILAITGLPTLDGYADVRDLATEMLEKKQITMLPSSGDAAFALRKGDRTASIRQAFKELEGMYWGRRMALDAACRTIRRWIEESFEQSALRAA